MHLQPLSDQALMAYCPDEQSALVWAYQVRGRNFPWLVDVVQAYTSVAVFFDPDKIDLTQVRKELAEISESKVKDPAEMPGRLHVIPCCYELGLDLDRVVSTTGLSKEEIIRLHAEQIYTVYAIGFCPGFPYLGYLPEALTGVSRLPAPRLKVEAGSVGLTGRQTGIYTEARPGGWNIVGRTPLKLVDVAAGYFPLRTGDRIQFRRIDLEEYQKTEESRTQGGKAAT